MEMFVLPFILYLIKEQKTLCVEQKAEKRRNEKGLNHISR